MNAKSTFIRDLKKSDEYLIEVAKLEFALELKALLSRQGTNNADFAESLCVSRPMVSKLLRGDANLTIESMIKATRCAGGKLYLKIVPEGTVARMIELVRSTDLVRKHDSQISRCVRNQSSAVNTTWNDAANEYEAEPLAA